jgi:iduronate 2-sulfatase
MWCKMSCLELGTRVPLIFKAPWLTGSVTGTISPALAELVDMYPTLSELAGLQLPTGAAGAYLGGTSLVPVLRGAAKQVKNATLSQFPRCWQNNTHHSGGKPGDENNRTVSWESMSDCHWTDRAHIDYMGYKMRTEEWSVTAWQQWDGAALRPRWGSDCGQHFQEGAQWSANARVGCFELYAHAGVSAPLPSLARLF